MSLLVHNVFNASIPRHHIPLESWEFEYGPAENDPEVASEELTICESLKDVEMTEGTERTPQAQDHPEASTSSGGRWVHTLTGNKIGGKFGFVRFTVIGYVSGRIHRTFTSHQWTYWRLTMANQMLSVVGSIQPDPFSPEHVPKRAAPISLESEEANEVLNELITEEALEDDLGEESDDENDTFRRLGKMADEAKRAELMAKQEAETAVAATKTAKKGKRKNERPAEESITQVKKAKKNKRKKVE